jgi:hypothetical protein
MQRGAASQASGNSRMDATDHRSKSWLHRNWKWAVPLGCLLPLVLVGGCIAAMLFAVVSLIKSSDAYQRSVTAVSNSVEVRAALGEPIHPSNMVTGNINFVNDKGHADISYNVRGPKGDASVSVVADKAAGQWVFKTNRVTIQSTGQTIDVPVD